MTTADKIQQLVKIVERHQAALRSIMEITQDGCSQRTAQAVIHEVNECTNECKELLKEI